MNKEILLTHMYTNKLRKTWKKVFYTDGTYDCFSKEYGEITWTQVLWSSEWRFYKDTYWEWRHPNSDVPEWASEREAGFLMLLREDEGNRNADIAELLKTAILERELFNVKD